MKILLALMILRIITAYVTNYRYYVWKATDSELGKKLLSSSSPKNHWFINYLFSVSHLYFNTSTALQMMEHFTMLSTVKLMHLVCPG